MKALLVLLVVLGILASGAAYYATYFNAEPPTSFRTAAVKRDTLLVTIAPPEPPSRKIQSTWVLR